MNQMAVEKWGEVASFGVESTKLSDQDAIEAYKTDGVICLRGVIGDDWLSIIESGIEESLRTANFDGGHSDKTQNVWPLLQPGFL